MVSFPSARTISGHQLADHSADARMIFLSLLAPVVGTGGAEKAQVHAMVQRLLPGVEIAGPDAADALAVAITHAQH